MQDRFDRRDFLRLAGLGGVVVASGLAGCATGPGAAQASLADDFYFVQLSDCHWGFEGPPNPDARGTLGKAVAAVNALAEPPDFVFFTGDLTHTTDDPVERRQRLTQFRDIAAGLKVKTVRYMPGEHDASLDRGEAFQEFFGATHYTFDHKGVHFLVLDNVSDPAGAIGTEQLAWVAADLASQPREARIVVFTHRPLFDLYPQWDWATRDGAKAIEILLTHPNVTVFYGHIHQEHHRMTGHIAHHAANSLMFALPPPGSQPKRLPVPWDATQPYKGLGYRSVEADPPKAAYRIEERGIRA
ncbi:MAG: metallophosphoesterase [Betaproteobacteria bacterium]